MPNKLKKIINYTLILVSIFSCFILSPNFVKAVAPPVPTNLQATLNTEGTIVTLTWESGLTIGTFSIYREKSNGEGDSLPPINPNLRRYEDTSVQMGTYYYSIRACSYTECSPLSDKVQITIIKDGINPGFLGTTPMIGKTQDSIFSNDGQYSYVVSSFGLQIIDITNNSSPKIISSLAFNSVSTIELSGNFVYLNSLASGTKSTKIFNIVNVSDPYKPVLISSMEMPSDISEITISGNTAFISCGVTGLVIADISNPYIPSVIGTVDTPGYAKSTAVSGNVAVIADQTSLRFANITDIHHPTLYTGDGISFPNIGQRNNTIVKVVIANGYAYVSAASNGLAVVNFNNPENPQVVKLEAPSKQFGDVADTVIANNKAYVALRSDLSTDQILQIYDMPNPESFTTKGYIETPGVTNSLTKSNNIVGYTCFTAGIVYINVSNADNPVFTAKITPTSQSLGVAVDQHHLYSLSLSTFQSSLKIYNKDNPLQIKQVGNLYLDSPVDIFLGGDGYAYIADLKNLKIVNITNPTNPQVVGTYTASDMVKGVFVANNKAYLACYQAGLVIVNVTNKNNPQKLGEKDTPGTAFSVAVTGNTAVVADNETVKVFNVQSPSNPTIVGSITPTNKAKDVAILNNTAYVAVSEQGLLPIDISVPNNPQAKTAGAPPTNNDHAIGVTIFNNRAYVAIFSYLGPDNGVQIFDISNQNLAPEYIGFGPSNGNYTRATAVNDRFIYLTNELYNTAVLDTYYDQLKVENTASAVTINSNQEITYTLKVTNPTPYTLTGLNLSSPIPPETTYLSATGGGTQNLNKVIWNLGSIAPNETKTVTFTALVN